MTDGRGRTADPEEDRGQMTEDGWRRADKKTEQMGMDEWLPANNDVGQRAAKFNQGEV